MSSLAPLVYLPVESRTRELASRILLARYLLSRGFRVVVGYNNTVISGSRWWPKGIYLLKGMNAVQKRMAVVLKEQGHRVVAIDEEALGIADDWFLTKDVDPEIQAYVDLVFCQGKKHREALNNELGFKDERLVVTGNPRIDLLRSPLNGDVIKRAEEIRRKYGRFMLVNTNSGSINNVWGDNRRYLGLLVEIGWFDPESEADRALVEDHLEHDRNNFQALRDLIKGVSERRPDISIIIRPHPSERSATWIEFASALPSVEVVSETEPGPWLQAADIVVTTGCTTGMEAALLGKPAISMVAQPEHVRHPGFFVANKVNMISETVSRTEELIAGHWDGTMDSSEWNTARRKEELAANIEMSDTAMASERIAEIIAASGLAVQTNGQAVEIHRDHEQHLRANIKRVKWDKGAFDTVEVKNWLACFDHYIGAASPIDVREISWSAFELTARSNPS